MIANILCRLFANQVLFVLVCVLSTIGSSHASQHAIGTVHAQVDRVVVCASLLQRRGCNWYCGGTLGIMNFCKSGACLATASICCNCRSLFSVSQEAASPVAVAGDTPAGWQTDGVASSGGKQQSATIISTVNART